MKLCFISGYDYRDALARFEGKHCDISSECFLKKPLSIEEFMAMVRKMTRDTTTMKKLADATSMYGQENQKQFA